MGGRLGYVDAHWYARLLSIALDQLPAVQSVRSNPDWAQSGYVDAGGLRLLAAYDYRDKIMYVEVAGVAAPRDGGPGLAYRPGVSVGYAERGTWLSDAPVTSFVIHESAVDGDVIAELGPILSVLGAHQGAAPQFIGLGLDQRRSRNGRLTLARAAGRAYRPWRLEPTMHVLRVPTPYGRLIVHGSPPAGAPWLARLVGPDAPPDDPSIGLRWVPSATGQRRESVAITWHEPGLTARGGRLPSLSEVRAVLRH